MARRLDVDDGGEFLVNIAAPTAANLGHGSGWGGPSPWNKVQRKASSELTEGGRKKRELESDLLRDVVIGFEEDVDDPVQAGDVAFRQSSEISDLGETPAADKSKVPICKQMRGKFVWYAPKMLSESAAPVWSSIRRRKDALE